MNTLNMSSQQGSVPFECPTARIDLRLVRANDQVLFWTESSCYSFLLTDAARRRGQLLRHDGQPCQATWLGAVAAADGKGPVEPAGIRVGARALFEIAVAGQTRRILTSAITKIVIIRQTALPLTQ